MKQIYLFVTPFFPTPESWRGAFCYDFARALIRTGRYDVRIFVHWSGRSGTGEDYDYNGLHVHRFRFHKAPSGVLPFLFDSMNCRSFMQKVDEVGIDWKDVSVYHSHELLFSSYARHVKEKYPHVKSVLHFHSGPLVHLRAGRFGLIPVHSELLYFYYRRILESVDLPVFVSRRQQRFFGNWYADGYLQDPVDIRKGLIGGRFLRQIALKPSIVCYNGIDYSVFNCKGRQIHSGLRIGCVGNFNEEKDQLTLLRALSILKDRHFAGLRDGKCIFIGSGSELDKCRAFAEQKELQDIVEFRPEIDHLDLPAFYRSLDLFILPSWIEGFGCSYIEAYGCGATIMGCRGVSVEEAFDKDEGKKWLFEPQDATGLAEKIERFYANREKQRLIHDFNIDDLVKNFIEKVESL